MQTLGLVRFQTAVLGLPCVDRVLGHSVLSGYVLRCTACLHLLQRSDDLRLRMPAPAHTLSSIRNHTSVCADLGEQVSCNTILPRAPEAGSFRLDAQCLDGTD